MVLLLDSPALQEGFLPAFLEQLVASSLQVSLVRQALSPLLASTQLLADNRKYTPDRSCPYALHTIGIDAATVGVQRIYKIDDPWSVALCNIA